MKRQPSSRALALLLCGLLAGCSGFKLPFLAHRDPAAVTDGMAATAPRAATPPAGASSAEALDTTTPAQRAAALAAPAPDAAHPLGKVVVALGKVTEPGFWLRSTLVTVARPGQVETASGAAVQVDLLPGTGPAQMSLAAFRALGLGLTDLAEVTVFGR